MTNSTEAQAAVNATPKDWIGQTHTPTYLIQQKMVQLGSKLEEEGFEIRYAADWWPIRADGTVHKSRAQSFAIYKSGQIVGTVKPWSPGWSHAIKGWEIKTIRGTGRSKYNNKKHLSKLSSAVKYIVETAIPRDSVEDRLERAEEELRRMAGAVSHERNQFQSLKSGSSGYGSDGLLRDILDAAEEGNKGKVEDLINERLRKLEDLAEKIDEMELAAEDYLRTTVQPLREKAKEAVPEVYGN